MAGTFYIVMRLLLLSLITTGVYGKDNLVFTGKGYDIRFPCEDTVCFHIWQFSTTTGYIAIISNGEIQTHINTYIHEDLKCTLKIKDLTAEDIGRHHCQQRPDAFPNSTHSVTPTLNLVHGMFSLQCVFLTYVKKRHCYTKQNQLVILTWVDEAGAKIQEDSQHQIKQKSTCHTTLTVVPQRSENKTFRCQATVGKQVHTSVELFVRVPAVKGRGRGVIIDVDPKPQGGKDVVGVGVGMVGCAVLAVVFALFVVNKRITYVYCIDRITTSEVTLKESTEICTEMKIPDESSSTPTINNDMNTDGVVYADINFPVGSDRACVHECDSTEYATIQCK
ncbi:hypothetical protein PAMP_014346 [Pampus punctatissimus]